MTAAQEMAPPPHREAQTMSGREPRQRKQVDYTAENYGAGSCTPAWLKVGGGRPRWSTPQSTCSPPRTMVACSACAGAAIGGTPLLLPRQSGCTCTHAHARTHTRSTHCTQARRAFTRTHARTLVHAASQALLPHKQHTSPSRTRKRSRSPGRTRPRSSPCGCPLRPCIRM